MPSPLGSGSAGVAGNWVTALRNRLVSRGGKGACRFLTGAASTAVVAVPPCPGVVASTGVDEARPGHGQPGGCERRGCLGCALGDRYLWWRGEASETGEGPEREATVSRSHLGLPRLCRRGFSSSVLLFASASSCPQRSSPCEWRRALSSGPGWV